MQVQSGKHLPFKGNSKSTSLWLSRLCDIMTSKSRNPGVRECGTVWRARWSNSLKVETLCGGGAGGRRANVGQATPPPPPHSVRQHLSTTNKAIRPWYLPTFPQSGAVRPPRGSCAVPRASLPLPIHTAEIPFVCGNLGPSPVSCPEIDYNLSQLEFIACVTSFGLLPRRCGVNVSSIKS